MTATGNLRGKIIALIVFTILCLMTFVFLFQAAGGRLRLSQPYNAKALVPESFNVVLNSDVRRDGVKIGRVRGIEPKGDLSEIKFEIEKKDQVPFYKDATVRVRTKTLVGESYLDVDPGKPTSGKLAKGATLPVEQAAQAVPLERILNTLDPATRREIKRNMAGLGNGLEGKGGKLNRMFGALPPFAADGGRLTDALEPQKRELARLIGNTGTVLQAFGERRAEAQNFVRSAKTTAEAVRDRDQRLRETFAELPSTLNQAHRSVDTLSSFSGRAAPTVRDLKVAARDLTPAIQDLEPTARAGRQLFRETPPFVKAAQPLLAQLNPGTKNLSRLVAPLDATLRQSVPALSYLTKYTDDFGSFFSNVGTALGATDANGNIGRVYGVVGPEQYTSISPDQQKGLDALLGSDLAKSIRNPRYEAYPKAGQANRPQNNPRTYPRLQPLGK